MPELSGRTIAFLVAPGASSRWSSPSRASWPSLPTDLRNAGDTWTGEEVVRDDNRAGTLITSRDPDDLPAFDKTLVEAFASSSAVR